MVRVCSFVPALALALALLLVAGCGSTRSAGPAADVRLRVQRAAAAPGDSVLLILDNGSAETVGYNLCTSGLERRVGDEWRRIESDRVCTMELRMLEPGRDARYALPLPADLPDGECRFVTMVERMTEGERLPVSSPPFRCGRQGDGVRARASGD